MESIPQEEVIKRCEYLCKLLDRRYLGANLQFGCVPGRPGRGSDRPLWRFSLGSAGDANFGCHEDVRHVLQHAEKNLERWIRRVLKIDPILSIAATFEQLGAEKAIRTSRPIHVRVTPAIIEFIGGPTGAECYANTPEFRSAVRELEKNPEGTFCLCAGAPGSWERCTVRVQDLIDAMEAAEVLVAYDIVRCVRLIQTDGAPVPEDASGEVVYRLGGGDRYLVEFTWPGCVGAELVTMPRDALERIRPRPDLAVVREVRAHQTVEI